MYQNEIKTKAEAALSAGNPNRPKATVFRQVDLQPLNFIAPEECDDAVHIARDILKGRTNIEINKIARVIDKVLTIGEGLLEELSRKMLEEPFSRKSVTLTQGRSLYLLCDYFDLGSSEVPNLHWGEVFATLTLMQAAEIVRTKTLQQEWQSDPDCILQAGLIASVPSTLKILQKEVFDSIIRAECLFDKRAARGRSGRSGGSAKATKMAPLKTEVINRYTEKYSAISNRKAGAIIEAELVEEKSALLNLSNSEELNALFARWIGVHKRSGLKMSLK